MNNHSRVTLGWPAAAVAVLALLAVGAGTAYLLMQTFSVSDQRMQDTARPTDASLAPEAPRSGARSENPAGAPLPDVVVALSMEAIKRAGIETGDRGEDAAGSSTVRIPGTVEPNAYKQVVVTPLGVGPRHASAGRTRRHGAAWSDLAAGLQPGAGRRPDEIPVRKGRARGARAGARPHDETRGTGCGQPAGVGAPARGARREAGGRAESPIAPRAARHADRVRSMPCRPVGMSRPRRMFRPRLTASSPSAPPTSV